MSSEELKHDLLKSSWEYLVDIGPRFMGTEGEKRAIHYLLGQLQASGIDPITQSFLYDGWSVSPDSSLHIVFPVEKELESYLLLGSGRPIGDHIEGKICLLGDTVIWNMYSWPRFGMIDEANKLVGYITGRPSGAAISQTLAEGNSDYPHFVIGAEDTGLLLNLLERGKEVKVKGKCDTLSTGMQEGANIRAILQKSQTKGKKVLLCAHYDTMYNTKGAYDNTSGVAVLLSVVKMLKDLEWLKPIEIVFMAGEEWNLAGSRAYVKDVMKSDLENIELVINVDGIGRGNVFEAWLGPEKLEHEMYHFFEKSNIDATKKLYIKIPPPPGSDHTPFYEAGIPVCMFTINDQDIIHSPRDVIDERIYANMIYCTHLLIELLKYKEVIS